jgi:hypothetical protein
MKNLLGVALAASMAIGVLTTAASESRAGQRAQIAKTPDWTGSGRSWHNTRSRRRDRR